MIKNGQTRSVALISIIHRNARGLPLVVCIHGGTYASDYFDADPSCSIEFLAIALSIPIIAIDSPGTKGSTPLPAPTNSGSNTYNQNIGRDFHNAILPALWSHYGSRTGASSIVLLGHSMGAIAAIVASSLHATACSSTAFPPSYPLSGLIISGIGHDFKLAGHPPRDDAPESILRTADPIRNLLMGSKHGLSPAATLALAEKLVHPLMTDASRDVHFWDSYWRTYAANITVPVLYALGDRDCYWPADDAHMSAFAAAFGKSRSVEWKRFEAAPHCLELSWYGRAWMMGCLGFAVECVVREDMGTPTRSKERL